MIARRRRTRASPTQAHQNQGTKAAPTTPGHQKVASWKNTHPEVAAATPPGCGPHPRVAEPLQESAVVPQARLTMKGTDSSHPAR